MNLEPVLAVWGGLYLDGEIVSDADIGNYVQDVLDELEFLVVSLLSFISLSNVVSDIF
jgi:alpha-N-arabinofuranosidase